MLFEKFLRIISRFAGDDPLAGRGDALAKLNPDKFYVENVRSVLGVSHRQAVTFCETAVRQGVFRRGVEVLCPDGVAGASAEREDQLPPSVHCWTEQNGHLEEADYPTTSLRKLTFYRLVDENAALAH